MTVDLSFCVRAVSLPQGPRPDGELDLVARSTTPNTPFGKSEIQNFCIFLKRIITPYTPFGKRKTQKIHPARWIQWPGLQHPNTPLGHFFQILTLNTPFGKRNSAKVANINTQFYNSITQTQHFRETYTTMNLHISAHVFRSLQYQLHIFTKIFVLLISKHVFNIIFNTKNIFLKTIRPFIAEIK